MGCLIPVMNKPQDEDKCHWVVNRLGRYNSECGLENMTFEDSDSAYWQRKCLCGKKIKVIE